MVDGRALGAALGWAMLGWAFAIAALFGLPLLVDATLPHDVAAWIPIYYAGAVGGFVLELVVGRGRLELPGHWPRERRGIAHGTTSAVEAADDELRRPLLAQLDLGFLARVLLGAIAAPTFLALYASAVDGKVPEALVNYAGEPATLFLAVFVGFAAPAVWAGAAKLVAARMAELQKSLAATAVAGAATKLKEAAMIDQEGYGGVTVLEDAPVVLALRHALKRQAPEDVDEMAAGMHRELRRVPVVSYAPEQRDALLRASGALDAARSILEA